MYHYALLRNTGHNQVFFQESLRLSLAELELSPLPLQTIREEILGGLSYLCFSCETALNTMELAHLARLSATYGLFLLHTGEESSQCQLSPVLLPETQIFPRSLATMLKYTGKTNEIFTRMMLNLALSLGNFPLPVVSSEADMTQQTGSDKSNIENTENTENTEKEEGNAQEAEGNAQKDQEDKSDKEQEEKNLPKTKNEATPHSPSSSSKLKLKILDPVAGRGTTLFEAFSLGADVYGVEIQEKAVQEGVTHLKKFLEKGKYKHKGDSRRFSGENKSFTAKKHWVDCGSQHFELICGDSKYVNQLFSPNYFHIIMGDLPYGVQHGSHNSHGNPSRHGGGHQSASRSPAQLLASCGKAWHTVLKKEGVLVLSWNTLVFSREKMVESLTRQGFQVLEHPPLLTLAHRVDQAITRDIIVARKTSIS